MKKIILIMAAFASMAHAGQWPSDYAEATSVGDDDPVMIAQGPVNTWKWARASKIRAIDAAKITDATPLGRNFLKIPDGSGVRYARINDDESITPLSASDFLAAIGGNTLEAGDETSLTWQPTGTSSDISIALKGKGGGGAAAIQSSDGTKFLAVTSAGQITGQGSLTLNGDIDATSFDGVGANLTQLNASNLSSGTVALARLSGVLKTDIGAGANLSMSPTTSATNANVSISAKGTGNVAIASDGFENFISVGGTGIGSFGAWNHTGNISSDTFTGDGSGLTSLNASNLATGNVPLARLTANRFGVVGDEIGLTIQPTGSSDEIGITLQPKGAGSSALLVDAAGTVYIQVGSGGILSGGGSWTHNGAMFATSFSGSGASLISLNASNLSSGTVPLARLSGVVKTDVGASTQLEIQPTGSSSDISVALIPKGVGAILFGDSTLGNYISVDGAGISSSGSWTHAGALDTGFLQSSNAFLTDDSGAPALEITSTTRKGYDFNGVASFDFGNRQIIAPGGDTLLEVRDGMLQLYSGSFNPGNGIVGSDGTAAASAGDIGELVEQARANQGVSTSPSNVGLLNLTAGDWDITVSGFMVTSGPGTVTMTKAALCISTVSATFQNPSAIFVGSSSAADEVNQPLAVMRPLRISSPTTIYIVGQLVGDGIVNAFTGNIYARRVR